MVEYTDKQILHHALCVFGALKERSFITFRTVICDWVHLFTGYSKVICEFTQTQMRVMGDGFVFVIYDFKHDREIHGRLQAIGIDAEAIAMIKTLFLEMGNVVSANSEVSRDIPVRVKYVNDHDTWRQVVEESGETMFVDEEDNENFIAEYLSRAEFDRAVNRFQGMVQYEVL